MKIKWPNYVSNVGLFENTVGALPDSQWLSVDTSLPVLLLPAVVLSSFGSCFLSLLPVYCSDQEQFCLLYSISQHSLSL